ncbi:SirB1 family protein [Azospirillum isscasi]|uniref:Transglutaminase-like domain-containing protein n=1 Tax=Azospirillum isscasi TaxID=3053926 RepID=A0ABU0WBU9_9PROT|nr:transglutaminase-like domain-containing protein [Azospirillum isscasi]MDQ2101650.1 transglutaminase-like domain-containing protein [Azospirillum isscasi]
MTSRAEAREILRRVGLQPDEDIDLAEAALALGVLESPGAVLADYRRHLADIAHDLAERVSPEADGLEARIAWLHEVIVERHGYSGDHDTYDDLQNANLLRVIDRRRGLPVALGILFLHAARSQGWPMQGLNFPGHFLVRLEADGARAILDPFNEGQVRTAVDLRDLLKATAGSAAELEPGHYQPVSNREVLLRLQNNIKLRHLSAHDVPRALEVLEAMRLFAPGEAALWRETGLLEAHTGNVGAAIAALETFLTLTGSERHRHQVAALIQQLKNRLN